MVLGMSHVEVVFKNGDHDTFIDVLTRDEHALFVTLFKISKWPINVRYPIIVVGKDLVNIVHIEMGLQ